MLPESDRLLVSHHPRQRYLVIHDMRIRVLVSYSENRLHLDARLPVRTDTALVGHATYLRELRAQ